MVKITLMMLVASSGLIADGGCSSWSAPLPGRAYMDSVYTACYAHRAGSKEWDEKNQEWLDSDSEESYPEECEDVEGGGYMDSKKAAQEAGR